MHFLFINGRFPQYSQTFVHDQIKTVKAQGAKKVSVFARSLGPFRFENSVSECKHELLYGKPKNFKLARRVVLGALRSPLLALRIMRLIRSKKLDQLTGFLALQLTEKPDVAVTHFGSNYEMAVQLKRYIFPQMKNVIVFHGHDISSYIRKNGWDNYKQAAPNIDCAICVNKLWASQLAQNTAIQDIKTIYLGTQIRPLSRRMNGDTSNFSILFVGRFVEKKGFDVLYMAVKNIVADGCRSIRVHCIGDGPDLKSAGERARSEGLSENFVFYGSRQKDFVQQMMNECDVLVAPSRTAQDGDSEGLPVVLFEAMAAGIPIISTYHSGIPEALSNEQTGLLVPESDSDALGTAIQFAIANPQSMTTMAEAARKHVELAHDERTQVRAFVRAIEDLA